MTRLVAVLSILLFLSYLSHCFSQMMKTFGTGLSANQLFNYEMEIFNHSLSSTGKFGVMTHFWCTGDPAIDAAIWKYYIDGESEASIIFSSSMSAGVGFGDTFGPWGNRWIGKNAKSGGWQNNFRIPFHKSIRITGQLNSVSNVTQATLWTIVRGSENLPTNLGGFTLPESARLIQQRIEGVTLAPLDWINMVDIPSGSGVLFFHVLAVQSGNLNFFEGCYHAYTPYKQTFPGLIVSTGTEDYFASAFYFDGGEFHTDFSGFTHFKQGNNSVEMSAYRLHDQDPIFFNEGFKFVWRNGDVVDNRGFKCIVENGSVVGSPTKSVVTAYSWTYVW